MTPYTVASAASSVLSEVLYHPPQPNWNSYVDVDGVLTPSEDATSNRRVLRAVRGAHRLFHTATRPSDRLLCRRQLYRPTAASLTEIATAFGECKAETDTNFVAYEVNVVHETTVEEDRDALIAVVEAEPTLFGVQFLETDGDDAEVCEGASQDGASPHLGETVTQFVAESPPPPAVSPPPPVAESPPSAPGDATLPIAIGGAVGGVVLLAGLGVGIYFAVRAATSGASKAATAGVKAGPRRRASRRLAPAAAGAAATSRRRRGARAVRAHARLLGHGVWHWGGECGGRSRRTTPLAQDQRVSEWEVTLA